MQKQLKKIEKILDTVLFGKSKKTLANAANTLPTSTYQRIIFLEPTVVSAFTGNIDFNGITPTSVTWPAGLELDVEFTDVTVDSGLVLAENKVHGI